MKKRYETPELRSELFDIEDVITASAPAGPIQHALQQVGDFMENMLDMFESMGQ